MINCKSFTTCSAPVCPLDSHIEDASYFPHEPICSSRQATKGLKWIKTQRKIARKTNNSSDIGYFTHEMLRTTKRVTPKTTGIDPDSQSGRGKFRRNVPSCVGSNDTTRRDDTKRHGAAPPQFKQWVKARKEQK
jgi:hypothetical protein